MSGAKQRTARSSAVSERRMCYQTIRKLVYSSKNRVHECPRKNVVSHIIDLRDTFLEDPL